MQLTNLQKKADEIRKEVVDVCLRNGAGHIAPSLSCVDILVSLYFSKLNIPVSSDLPEWKDRDRLVFSKAHGAYALYAILADKGLIEKSDWQNFYKGSFLRGCVERSEKHGLEASCGSLGHGLPMAVGLAFGAKMAGYPWKTYCIMGDGETQEGTVWEALQFAAKHNLSNLAIVIDANGLQAMDFLEDVLTVTGRKNDIPVKMEAFGCCVRTIDGHDMDSIESVFSEFKSRGNDDQPFVIVANTTKGYGVLSMENIAKFHFRLPTEEEMKQGVRYDS